MPNSVATSPTNPAQHDHSSINRSIDWSIHKARELYRVNQWGNGYFDINQQGHLIVTPSGQHSQAIDLQHVLQTLKEQGFNTPILLHFSDIIKHRLQTIARAFDSAIAQHNYNNTYQSVYPIKVNQQQHIVNEIAQHGRAFNIGLEAGSKPELLILIAMTKEAPNQLIICNGFKDSQYIQAVILAHKLGRTIIPVIENLAELDQIIAVSTRCGVRPRIGVRIKLTTPGTGRWANSTGTKSKFGLTTTELLRAVSTLKDHGMLDCLDLLHCHTGSQHQDINTINSAVTELARTFVELRKLGAPLTHIDIGGGLGVDYQGSCTDEPSSMNYTLDQYASTIVSGIGSICDAAREDHPIIVTESGRAMVAHSSMLIVDVLCSSGPADFINPEISSEPAPSSISIESPQPILDLLKSLNAVDKRDPPVAAIYCDVIQARDQASSLFSQGAITLHQQADAQRLFWTVCAKIQSIINHRATQQLPIPKELSDINEQMSEVYFCNFSIFQSLPDAWAIDQFFPMMPIARLNQAPTRSAVLADITCDSDGQINTYINPNGGIASTLPVHALDTDDTYYIGAFLVGAYQETLGDLHNLFGDAHAVHIKVDEDGWTIDELNRGDSVRQVLSYVQYDSKNLTKAIQRECETGVRKGSLSVSESRTMQSFYASGLDGYTYLDPDIELT
ncbi:MAG: biosynthetic arginine decarboxylase [Phycisphaerales bacterium]